MQSLFQRRIQRLCAFLAILAGIAPLRAAEFRDLFSDRETLVGDRGQISGNNTGATVESGEPRHGGKYSRHSLWISWVAPDNGLATFRLNGTGIDSVLGIYQIKADDDDDGDPPIRRLETVAKNDDDGAYASCLVQFGVQAGERFEIAVDGFAGAVGPLVLEWDLQVLKEIIPRISLVSGDRAATLGETVTLAVNLGPGVTPKLHWVFNNRELEDEEDLNLVIPNFQATNVGRYQVRVEVSKAKFFSEPVELQVSSEGVITALARNKPEDALDSPLSGPSQSPSPAPVRARLAPAGLGLSGDAGGLTRGYNGTQIFNTVFAGRDLNEPQHCGVAGGASYWFAYEPPESGTLQVNTDGSAFDTVLEVYTFDPPLIGYSSLRSLECDNNSGANGLTSRLHVNCEVGRTYLIVVDGVNGARGLTYLNYRLDTNSAAVLPPVPGPTPAPIAAAVGSRVELTVSATGTAPFRFLWRHGVTELSSETNATLVLDPVRLSQAGEYSVSIANDAGNALVGPVPVSVWSFPELRVAPDGSGASLRFIASGPAAMSVESAGSMTDPNWVIAARSNVDGTPVEVPLPLSSDTRFFRVRID